MASLLSKKMRSIAFFARLNSFSKDKGQRNVKEKENHSRVLKKSIKQPKFS